MQTKKFGQFLAVYVVTSLTLIVILERLFNRQPTDVSYRFTEKGEKVRVSERTGRIIPKPPWERRDWKARSAVKGIP